MERSLTLTERLAARADEIEGFAADPDALAPSGCDTHTAELLREAAKTIQILRDGYYGRSSV